MATSSDALAAVLRRDRTVMLVALAVLTAAAWLYILLIDISMNAPSADMAPMGMSDMAAVMAPRLTPWTLSHAGFVFVMWAAMMVGMMTPSAAPMVLTYTAVARQADSMGKPFAAAGWFVCGYLFAWTAFSLAATAGQWALEQLALLTPMMAAASARLGGATLIVAGLYQWTPAKNVCLEHCRAPLSFVQRHGGFKRSIEGSLKLGLLHGAYCIGCCWALMMLLFVGGVMNVLWIAALTILVFAEKLFPAGRWLARIAGTCAIAAGTWMLATS